MATKGRRLVRACLIGLLAWAALSVLPAGAAELTEIEVNREDPDTNVIIRGGYSSYRAFSMPDPARLVVDFDGTSRGEGVPRLIEVGDGVLSKIRAGQGRNRVRIVLDSSKKQEPFHFNIGEQDGSLRIRCWRPKTPSTAVTEVVKEDVKPLSDGFPEKELRDVLGMTGTEKRQGLDAGRIAKYSGAKIDHIDFYQEDLHNVFRLFGEMFGKNFIVDDQVQGTLTLSLKDVPWDLAMEIIADMKNLQVTERADILVVRPKEEKSEGELVVKSVPEEALHPARIQKEQKEEQRRAREIVLTAHNLEKEGKLREALELYEEAYEAWKDNLDLLKKTSYLHYRLGQYARSSFFAKEALKVNMKDAEAALYGALSAAQMDEHREAELFFEAAINGEPKLPEAFQNYGLFLDRSGKYTEALRVYQRHEEIFGPSLKVSLAIAEAFEAKGRDSEACKRYRNISFSGFPMDEATERNIEQKIETLCN